MAKNPTLVPVPVTDCNGVQTTRWKRPAAAGSKSAAAIPSPAAARNEAAGRAVALRRAVDNYVSVLRDEDASFEAVEEIQADVREQFSSMPTGLLKEIADIDDYSWFKTIALKSMLEDGESPAAIRDMLQVADALIEGSGVEEQIVDYARVFSSYPGLEPFDGVGDYPELRREQLRGIAAVTEAIEVIAYAESVQWPRADNGATVIEDRALLALALEAPARTAAVIRERHTLDPKEIAVIVRSTTPALSAGRL